MGDCPLRAALCGDDAIRAIRIAATRLSRTEGFSSDEVEDLEGEIRLRILESIDRFDPRRAGVRTYISRKAEWAAGEIGRDRRRQKRWNGSLPLSLGAPVHEEEPGRESLADRVAGAMTAECVAELLRVKIARLLQDAPPLDAAVARGLMAGKTENAIALELGESRRQVRGAMERMRLLFERSDLQEI